MNISIYEAHPRFRQQCHCFLTCIFCKNGTKTSPSKRELSMANDLQSGPFFEYIFCIKCDTFLVQKIFNIEQSITVTIFFYQKSHNGAATCISSLHVSLCNTILSIQIWRQKTQKTWQKILKKGTTL